MKKLIWGVISLSLCLMLLLGRILLSGNIRGSAERANAGKVYVTGRPDLSVGCDAECPAWAKSHASDFLDGNGVPISQAKSLHIAIMQYVMSPAPETIVFRCALSSKNLRRLLQGKKRRFVTYEKVIQEVHGKRFPILVFPFKSLSWWPPQKSSRSRLKIYDGMSSAPGGYHYIFIDGKSNMVWVLASASRGR